MKKGRRKFGQAVTDAEFAETAGVYRDGEGTNIILRMRTKVSDAAKNGAEAVLRYREVLIRIVLPTLYCLLFGGTGFAMGIYPFGISAVCATVSGIPAFIAAAAVAVSSLFVRSGFYIAFPAVVGAVLIAIVGKLRQSADTVVFRGILSVIVGVLQATVFSISGGIRFYELCGILLSAVFCPVITVSLNGLFKSDGHASSSLEAGIYVMLYTAVYFLRGLSYTGESAATVISMLSVLYASYAFGIHRGIAAGVAVGLAAEPIYSAVYAVAGAGAGVLMGISPIGATVAGVLLALSFGIYGAGATAFGELFPEFMFCAAVAGPLFYYGIVPVPSERRETKNVLSGDINGIRLEKTKNRLRALSDGLGAVSASMRRMSKVFCRPSMFEIRQICDNAFDESCKSCDDRGACWDREYRTTSSALNTVAHTARSGKPVSISALPEGMRKRCPYLGGIVSRINMGASSAVRTSASNDRTATAAESYDAVSRLIDEVASVADTELEPDEEGTEKLSARLSSMGLARAEVSVYGSRRRYVTVKGLEHGCAVTGAEICAAAESVLGCAMSAPEYRICGRTVSFEMHTAERFAVELGRCSVAKMGEKKCGDSITSFKGDGGYSYVLISDGMGSGGEAALTSGSCAMFLERMLGAGCSLSSSMEMLNSFLAGRSTECFTTVDLMEADLVTGEFRFVKSGAAPSFVLRDGKLFKLSSKTVPVGIITPYDAEQLTFSARAGDHVIMLSDGVVPDGGEAMWLYDLFCCGSVITENCDLAKAAEKIAAAAAEKNGYGDDVTVGVVRIKETRRRSHKHDR